MTMNRILVVDDKEDNRYLMRSLLQGHGYEVVTATQGAEALELARLNPPDLIITDILMPVMDGFALCREWKKDGRLKPIPFVFYTATYTHERDREFALSLGAERFILKPEETDVLMTIVRETIQQAGAPPAARTNSAAEAPIRLPLESPEGMDPVYLKQYNETLFRKMEAKLEQLDQAKRELEQVIAAHQTAEAALCDSESCFHSLIEAAPEGIFVQCEGRFVYLNPALLRLLGAARVEDLLGEKFMARIAPDYHENVRERIRMQLETGKPAPPMDQEYLRLDGSRVPVETTAVPVRYQGHDAHLVFVRDITERNRVTTERARLMAAIEQAGEMIMITDPEGIIQYVNPAFETETGYPRQEACGQTPRILKSDKHDEAFYRELWSTISGGDLFRGRMVNRRKDGTLYTEDATISPVCSAAGRIVNYVAVKRNITEDLRLASELQQAQKMESVGRLAGGVAHDFNNMLGVILGYAELAMDKLDPSGSLYADLQEIRKAAERSTEMTRQLLAFARKQAIAPQVLDLNKTVEGMLKMLRRLIGEDIDLTWHPGAGVWPIKVDPSQIDQILANLCVNARDAIADVGKITIETDTATFDQAYCDDHAGFVPGDFVLLAVSDDGCGMDHKVLDNLFEPFFTTKAMGQGTGLGLATVYGIVKQNNGFINVYSEPGNGTTFRIYLSRHRGKVIDPRKKSTTEIPPGLGETILLVEDEVAILNLSRTMLENLGYHVLTANTPGEAERLAGQHASGIHLLMTDVVMPEMNGRDLAGRLLSMNSNLKLLFMSGYTATVIGHRGVLDEGMHFIQKPFSMKALAAKVREALDQK